MSWERRGGGGALVAARGGGGRSAGWGGCAVAGFRGERTPAVRKEALPFPEPPWHPASGTDGLCQNPPPPLLYRPDASRGAGRSPGPGRPKAPQVRPVQARVKLREEVPAAALAARARGRVRGARGGGEVRVVEASLASGFAPRPNPRGVEGSEARRVDSCCRADDGVPVPARGQGRRREQRGGRGGAGPASTFKRVDYSQRLGRRGWGRGREGPGGPGAPRDHRVMPERSAGYSALVLSTAALKAL